METVRSDTYRLRHLLDKALIKNTNGRWSLYKLIYYHRVKQPLSWSGIAYLVNVMSNMEVSGESLRRWSLDGKGNLVEMEVFYGKEVQKL